jgi:hypothetical protein
MSEAKPFTRIVTDAAGGSVFADGEIPLQAQLVAENFPALLVGTLPAVSAVVYVRGGIFSSDPDPVPHRAPRRQWVVILRGAMEVQTTDGSRRTFGPGDLVRAEDTDGAGHITARAGDGPVDALILPC